MALAKKFGLEYVATGKMLEQEIEKKTKKSNEPEFDVPF